VDIYYFKYNKLCWFFWFFVVFVRFGSVWFLDVGWFLFFCCVGVFVWLLLVFFVLVVVLFFIVFVCLVFLFVIGFLGLCLCVLCCVFFVVVLCFCVVGVGFCCCFCFVLLCCCERSLRPGGGGVLSYEVDVTFPTGKRRLEVTRGRDPRPPPDQRPCRRRDLRFDSRETGRSAPTPIRGRCSTRRSTKPNRADPIDTKRSEKGHRCSWIQACAHRPPRPGAPTLARPRARRGQADWVQARSGAARRPSTGRAPCSKVAAFAASWYRFASTEPRHVSGRLRAGGCGKRHHQSPTSRSSAGTAFATIISAVLVLFRTLYLGWAPPSAVLARSRPPSLPGAATGSSTATVLRRRGLGPPPSDFGRCSAGLRHPARCWGNRPRPVPIFKTTMLAVPLIVGVSPPRCAATQPADPDECGPRTCDARFDLGMVGRLGVFAPGGGSPGPTPGPPRDGPAFFRPGPGR